jgi:hypothetical protein
MSENPMDGFGSPGPDQPEDSPAAGRNPKVLIGGGIALAVVAVLGGYLFLGGGGGSDTPTTPVAAGGVHHPTPTATVSAVVVVGKPTPAVKTFNGDVGRDPFAPLITSPPAPKTSAPKPTSAAPTTTAAAPPTITPTTLPAGQSLPPTTLPTTTTAAPTVAPTTTHAPQSVLVVLKAIVFPPATPTTPYVKVTYGGANFQLKTGQTANGSLKVVAIAPDDGVATFQLGDQTFDLHIGQSFVD